MRRSLMRSAQLNTAVRSSVLALTILLFVAGTSFAQSTVNLTATRQTTTLPDGNTVPMWGWVCGTPTAPATCTAMNGLAQTTVTVGTTTTTPWQPPLIIVPYAGATTSLSITLTNSLPVETSLVIVGQLGTGITGLGNPQRESAARTHNPQSTATWPIAGASPDTFTPPAQ